MQSTERFHTKLNGILPALCQTVIFLDKANYTLKLTNIICVIHGTISLLLSRFIPKQGHIGRGGTSPLYFELIIGTGVVYHLYLHHINMNEGRLNY